MLAVKRLFSSHESDFENETGMLIPLTNEKHNHLVELLATYKYKGKYHFLFPYANANLRSLWAQKPKPRRSTTNYEWALDQMTGLASGLVVVHQYKLNMAYNPAMGHAGITRFRQSARRNLVVDPAEEKYGRHGDLKPENILLVKELKGDDLSGILQIADFGLGRFHRFESKSRVDPKTIVGSATYMPPELSLEKQVSRAYDIWSLGCVYLEFATWLLEGSAGLDEFTDKRAEAGLDAVTDDTFYSLVDGGAVVRRSVHHWIEHLCNSPRCSNMVYDLLKLLQNRLVVVDPASRINAEDLYKELKKMIQKSKDSNQYLVGRDG
jgi:serine/threonine protein kinase